MRELKVTLPMPRWPTEASVANSANMRRSLGACDSRRQIDSTHFHLLLSRDFRLIRSSISLQLRILDNTGSCRCTAFALARPLTCVVLTPVLGL